MKIINLIFNRHKYNIGPCLFFKTLTDWLADPLEDL